MEASGSEPANENIFKSVTIYKYLYVWINVNCNTSAGRIAIYDPTKQHAITSDEKKLKRESSWLNI